LKTIPLLIATSFLFTSCAHHFQDAKSFNYSNVPLEHKVSIDPNYKMKGVYDFQEDKGKKLADQYVLPALFSQSNTKESDFEMIELNLKDQSLSPMCATGYVGWFLISLVTIGIIPIMSSNQVEAVITLKNKKSGELKQVTLKADHTQGVGWLYWIRAWTNDDWLWRSEVPERYKPLDKNYFRDYSNWAINQQLSINK